MSTERNTLPLNTMDDEGAMLPLSDVTGNNEDNKPLTSQQLDTAKRTSSASGFPDRPLRRRRPTKSPHTAAITIRARPETRKMFRDYSDEMGIYDYETFERAIIALLKQEGRTDQLQYLREVIN